MKHLFVPYELALKLKEKGFDEPCFGYYLGEYHNHFKRLVIAPTDEDDSEIRAYTNSEHINAVYNKGDLSAPLYQQVIDWFRENHCLYIHTFTAHAISYIAWGICIYDLNKTEDDDDAYEKYSSVQSKSFVKTYYEALNKAIEEALKLI